ncbi:MAG TPA: APC family permease [Actinomycetota bacterium]|nr:APC family permease [Actinomycetota bacterium]
MATTGVEERGLERTLGTWAVFVAGVGLVVATSTLVSDFVGYFSVGVNFFTSLIIAFLINLFLGLSASELSTTYPKAGALYEYGAAAMPRESLGTIVGLFLAFTFYGMFAIVGPLEFGAGARGLQAFFNASGSLWPWIVIMVVLATIPNLLHVKQMAIVEAFTLVGMLGLRWFFGLAGFAGFSRVGGWSAANWDVGVGLFDWSTALTVLALSYWSFVGIEFVCPLAEEVRDPRRSLPIGIVLGLLAILATSLFMAPGVAGTQPVSKWAELALGPAGCDGNCPQLAVGEAMFGGAGRGAMAFASVLATYTSMTIVLAAMPRILYGAARDGHFFGPLSRAFAWLHPRFRSPWVAILVTAALYIAVTIPFNQVVDMIFSAAYAWVILYVIWHVLVIVSRFTNPHAERPFRLPLVVPVIGIAGTILALYYAYAGAHGIYGVRSLWVFGGALVAALISYGLRGTSGIERRPAEAELAGEAGS